MTKELAPTIAAIAREAGELALSHVHALSGLAVESKGHLDLVTKADQEVEAFLIAALRNAFPEDGVFGEEGGDIAGASGRTWVIDPIDGTFNFVRGGQDWGISIGLYQDRRPVFGVIFAPVRGLMVVGGKEMEAQINGEPLSQIRAFAPAQASVGLSFHPSIATAARMEAFRFIFDALDATFRFNGAATISLLTVALGETDGYLSLGDSTWDVMAALPILESLGAVHTIDWDKTELSDKLRFACGKPAFVSAVPLALLSGTA